MPVTLYGINKFGQVFRSYVTPDEVDYYVKEKGLSTEPIEEPKAPKVPEVEKPVEKAVSFDKPFEKSKKSRPRKEIDE